MLDFEKKYTEIISLFKNNEIINTILNKEIKISELDNIYEELKTKENIKKFKNIIVEYVNTKNLNKHEELIPFLKLMYLNYNNYNFLTKKINKITFKNQVDNVFILLEENNYKVRKSKLSKLLSLMLIDFIILDNVKI